MIYPSIPKSPWYYSHQGWVGIKKTMIQLSIPKSSWCHKSRMSRCWKVAIHLTIPKSPRYYNRHGWVGVKNQWSINISIPKSPWCYKCDGWVGWVGIKNQWSIFPFQRLLPVPVCCTLTFLMPQWHLVFWSEARTAVVWMIMRKPSRSDWTPSTMRRSRSLSITKRRA